MPQALSLISLSNTLTIKEQSQYFIQFTQISLSLLFNTSQPHQFCSQCRNLLIPLDHLSCWWHPLFVVTAIWLLHLCWRWRRYDVDLIDSSAAVSENYEDEKATIWLLHLRWRWQYDVLVASAVTTTMVTTIWLLHQWWWQRRYDNMMCLLIVASVVTMTTMQWCLIVASVVTMTIRRYDVLVAGAVMMTMVQQWFDCCISDDDDTTIRCACCISGGDDDDTTIRCACLLLHQWWRRRNDDDVIVASPWAIGNMLLAHHGKHSCTWRVGSSINLGDCWHWWRLWWRYQLLVFSALSTSLGCRSLFLPRRFVWHTAGCTFFCSSSSSIHLHNINEFWWFDDEISLVVDRVLVVDNGNFCDMRWDGFFVVCRLRRNLCDFKPWSIISYEVLWRLISNEWKLKLLSVRHGSYAKFGGESIGALYFY